VKHTEPDKGATEVEENSKAEPTAAGSTSDSAQGTTSVPSLWLLCASAVKQAYKPSELKSLGIPNQLQENVYASSGKGWLPINHFLAHIALVAGSLSSDEKASSTDKRHSGVVISTIHSAKGLEWNTVFVPHFYNGMLPSVYRSSPPSGALRLELQQAALVMENPVAHREEEARLAHVAFTRAQERLFVSQPRVDNRLPEPMRCEPSLFERHLMQAAVQLGDREQGARTRATGMSGLLAEHMDQGAPEASALVAVHELPPSREEITALSVIEEREALQREALQREARFLPFLAGRAFAREEAEDDI